MQENTAPTFLGEAFHCPHCKAYAHQRWFRMYGLDYDLRVETDPYHEMNNVDRINYYSFNDTDYVFSQCFCCKQITVWYMPFGQYGQHDQYASTDLVYPEPLGATFIPNVDLDEEIQRDFAEAASIVYKSPRGAAALLRLCLEKLLKQLGFTENKLRSSIDKLLEKGISPEIIDAMNSVRVVGNHAVHPGKIDLQDDLDTALMLFELINFVADQMLTQPKRRQEFYGRILPKR